MKDRCTSTTVGREAGTLKQSSYATSQSDYETRGTMRTQRAVAVVSENSNARIELVSDRKGFLAKIADYQH